MNKPPSFQFYAQDFLTGVMYLTNEERGIYITMLAKQWSDGKIPKKRLGFLVGCDWDELSEELKNKFEDKGEYLVNNRLERERDKKEKFLNKQRENGKKGGRPLKNSTSEKPKRNPNKSLSSSSSSSINSINANEQFDFFWDTYDKKVDKKKCLKQWGKLTVDEIKRILDSVEHYVKQNPNRKYRKNPLTYLNGKNWEDEIDFGAVNWDVLLDAFNELTGKKVPSISIEAKNNINVLLKTGYSKDDFWNAINHCFNDAWHKKNPHVLTLEYISRQDNMEKYFNKK
ncbi:DUF1376 domain-containing protein [Flagellimonas nanhaiensis]|uniref:DUF1376 domain-containing protein n=1 Tax=Flagellimonas nanhaiensis TaxID=2292706 RepID=A0A371JP11_9FLAO|nr:DUF1376 domain-containing protein [Allomuricauda nanhaiensis]RDY58910.1 DUF1376 domain-containing protein [Allomuricauda nanhaiensis]